MEISFWVKIFRRPRKSWRKRKKRESKLNVLKLLVLRWKKKGGCTMQRSVYDISWTFTSFHDFSWIFLDFPEIFFPKIGTGSLSIYLKQTKIFILNITSFNCNQNHSKMLTPTKSLIYNKKSFPVLPYSNFVDFQFEDSTAKKLSVTNFRFTRVELYSTFENNKTLHRVITAFYINFWKHI